MKSHKGIGEVFMINRPNVARGCSTNDFVINRPSEAGYVPQAHLSLADPI